MAKKHLGAGAMLAPLPAVLVSVADGERKNIFTVAWAGTVCTKPSMVSVSVRKERFSYDFIDKTGEFCINLPSADMARAVDFCGVKSGREVDKFESLGLTAEESEHVKCPSVGECPVSVECKVRQKLELGTHDMFIAEVLGVAVDERLVEASGRIALEKADLLAYAHGDYFTLGKKVGDFGFSVRKKKKKRSR